MHLLTSDLPLSVGLAASVPESDVAVAGSGMYLCVNIGGIAGTAAGSAVFETALRKALLAALSGVKGGPQVRIPGGEWLLSYALADP